MKNAYSRFRKIGLEHPRAVQAADKLATNLVGRYKTQFAGIVLAIFIL